MKKVFLCLLIICCAAVCCGCNNDSGVKPILNDISFIADISYKDSFYSCDSSIDSNGTLNLTLLSPETLKDMIIYVEGDNVTVDYLGLTYTPDTKNFPVNSAVKLFYETITDVRNKTLNTESGSNAYISGNYNDYNYKFTFSPSGLPIELTVDSIKLKIEFKDVKINNSNQP